MREWNGEENREQENGLIFLTHTACHRDVWAPLRIKATRKWSFLCLGLSFASKTIYDLQLVVNSVSILTKRDIWRFFLCFLCRKLTEILYIGVEKGCFQASICTVDAAGTSRMPDS